jgi:hypothetical protein
MFVVIATQRGDVMKTKKTIVINFGNGMEHIKKVEGKDLIVYNSGYTQGDSFTIKIKDVFKQGILCKNIM